MNDPTMNTILANVEDQLKAGDPVDPNVTKFAPPKFRGTNFPNGELENIQGAIRKSLGELLEHQHRLAAYTDNLKVTIETLQRNAG